MPLGCGNGDLIASHSFWGKTSRRLDHQSRRFPPGRVSNSLQVLMIYSPASSPYWEPAFEHHWPAFSLMKLNSALIKIFLVLGMGTEWWWWGGEISFKIVCGNAFKKGNKRGCWWNFRGWINTILPLFGLKSHTHTHTHTQTPFICWSPNHPPPPTPPPTFTAFRTPPSNSAAPTDTSECDCIWNRALKKEIKEFPLWLSQLRTWHSVREDSGLIPGLAQWVKRSGITVSIGCRCGLDLALLWLQ